MTDHLELIAQTARAQGYIAQVVNKVVKVSLTNRSVSVMEVEQAFYDKEMDDLVLISLTNKGAVVVTPLE